MNLNKTISTFLFGASLAMVGWVGSAAAVPFAIGDIFASVNSGNIQHYNSAGVLLETLNTTRGGFTTGSAFDDAGNFYVTDFSAGSVSKFTGPGDAHTPSVFAGSIGTPESIVFMANGHVMVGSLGTGIREYLADGTFVQTILSGRVDWFDIGADQDTILYTQEGSQVRQASVSGGAGQLTSIFHAGAGDFALRILGDGTVLVANNESVLHLSADGSSVLGSYDVAGVDGFFALNVDPDGTSFLTGSFQNDTIYRFDIAAGGAPLQTIATGTGGGNLFGLSIFGEITVVDPPPPMPEPATLALLGIALAGLGYSRRKQ